MILMCDYSAHELETALGAQFFPVEIHAFLLTGGQLWFKILLTYKRWSEFLAWNICFCWLSWLNKLSKCPFFLLTWKGQIIRNQEVFWKVTWKQNKIKQFMDSPISGSEFSVMYMVDWGLLWRPVIWSEHITRDWEMRYFRLF